MTELKDWIRKNGTKLQKVYSYAVLNKMDIRSTNDIINVLEKIDSENANLEQAKIYSKILPLFRNRFRETIEDRLKG